MLQKTFSASKLTPFLFERIWWNLHKELMKNCTADRLFQILYSIVHLKWKTEVEKINLPSEATLLMAISELGIFPWIVHSQNIAKAQWTLWGKKIVNNCHCIFPWLLNFNTSQRQKMGSGVECSFL